MRHREKYDECACVGVEVLKVEDKNQPKKQKRTPKQIASATYLRGKL